MAVSPGDLIGHYKIQSFIGRGGMGEVYQALDTKLEREVAIKVLPAALANDTDRLVRFEREAKVLGQLNHPGIASVYGVEERALVMELVTGPTLADRIKQGPMPPAEVEQILLEIADALDYAHERGVIHRDLKPANIKIDPEDKVKILDFGLAKALTDPASSSGDPTDSPTVTMGGTIAGTILGTAAYMSPEQARGKKVDKRADIWAFGVVAWEMLTGERLFKGEDAVQVLGRVLEQPLEFDRVPPRFRKLLERCLDRNVKDRLRDVGEARFLLAESAAPVVTLGPQRVRWLPWTLFAIATPAAIALGIIAYRHSTEEAPRLLRSTVQVPEKAILSPVGLPAVSPDGRHIAYVATVDGKAGLWVRDLDAPAPRLLIAEDANYPFWSPDSRSIAFGSLGKLKRVEVSGGPALTLCDVALFRGGTWSQNDVILFGSFTGSFRVSAAGGAPAQVTTVDQDSGALGHFFPWFLPDGRHFLYLADAASEQSALYVGDLDSKERKRLQLTQYNAVYASGYLLFLRERTLMAQRFDTGKLETTGDAVPIAEQVDTGGAPNRAYFSASQNGVLAFTSGALAAQITWLDRSGKPAGTIGGPGDIRWTAISPDGKTVAFDRMDEQTGKYNIWLHAVAGGADSRFTFNSKSNRYPVWSQPDGASIAFTSDQAGHLSAYRKAVGGSGKEEAVDADALVKLPTDWSPDGRYVIEEAGAVSNTRINIWVAPVTRNGEKAGGEKPHPYLQSEFNEGDARVSPNGKWLAYRSDETKRNEVYVMTFPNPGGKWQISTNGGSLPVWSRDGKELFFVSADNKMMAVDIRGTGANPEPGVPHPLFEVRLGPNNPRYDVAKDGRFLAPLAADQAAGGSINVVVNWMAGLKK